MAAIVKYRTTILKLVSVAVLWSASSGCTGALVYHPKKETKPATPAGDQAKNRLPPPPDIQANNATLAGIDTTRMGIRDDVHLWIYTNYTTKIKRTILMTMANVLQGVLANTPETTEEALNLEQSYKDASMMLRIVRGLKPEEVELMDTLLYKQIFNTPERLNAYLQYNLLLTEKKK